MDREKRGHDVEELKQVLGVVSKEVPTLIKGIRSSIFSEEAGRDMGRSVAAMYKELREAGIPEQTAVKMVEGYISAFTNIGNIITKTITGGKDEKIDEVSKKIHEEVHRKIAEKLGKNTGKHPENTSG